MPGRKEQDMKTGKSYNYSIWDAEENKTVTVEIRVGHDGVTKEDIEILMELDRQEARNNEGEDRLKDHLFEVQKKESIETGVNPFDGDKVMKALDKAPASDNLEHAICEVERAVKKLTPAQQDLFYEYFGMQRKMSDIGRDNGTSRKAVFGRKERMVKSLERLLKEAGIDRP